MEHRKYERLVHPFQPEVNNVQAGSAGTDYVYNPRAYFRGGCQIPGANAVIGFNIIQKPYFLDRFPHVHQEDEYLTFLGASMNVFDFDAEISLTIGREVDGDAETFLITQPTIVRIPAGVWHCPLDFVRIGKPVFFQPALMQGVFGGTYDMPGGQRDMYYNGPIDCVLEPGKKCTVCKRCLTADWQNERNAE